MERRQVLKSISLAVTAGLLPNSHLMAMAEQFVENDALSEVYRQFQTALANNPKMLGFSNVDADFSPRKLDIEGRIPADLIGTFYRNGPAKHERGQARYKHLFEGDGMLQAFSIGDGEIEHKGRFITTPKFNAEQQAQRFLYSGPESRLSQSRGVTGPNDINVANTNVISVNDSLWALWEAGAPALVDKNTLEFDRYAILGEHQHYGKTLDNMPFSAHPRIEASGDIWNFGLNATGHLVLYHLAKNGDVNKVKVVATGYKGMMVHDFLITEKHVIIVLPSLISKRNKPGFFERIAFEGDLPMQIILYSKDDFSEVRRYELPAGFAFHYGNAWEDRDGTIHFDASLYPDLSVLTALGKVMAGEHMESQSDATNVLIRLYPDGRYEMEDTGIVSEFPRIASSLIGKKHSVLYHLSSQSGGVWSDTLSRLDLKTETYQHFHFGHDYLVEEHVPVGNALDERSGYLIGTALHVPSKRTCLNVFKADSVYDGPIARAWLPYHLPLGFHGNFVA
ncbi:carotenoid oxygenase family protein [Alteromonas sp. KUL49]|uniref:carotenoid oxygenase family protein n=1 Tax=Alteromonas sp. KUL49 TaxID=2480798 RepID=UPI00102EF5D2|nr:carotenoid oxygenase family protein [Alteromonas sp. KUL49]TAP38965.1 lignostilbene alpha-beta-dioxygenase [Alteromonas sp. KUL49]GEA12407.1 hypothetical protein KUL49_27820 [Alteromonas sp. KUL49]